MTSQIDISTIDPAYPVAGQDNDTQGFRDNFSAISDNLGYAKNEIEKLQSRTLLAANLSDNSTVNNDLNGSTINNGSYNNFYGTFYNEPNTATTDISVANGAVQLFRLAGDHSYLFRDWPEADKFGVVRVHFVKSDESAGGWDITSLTTEGGGDIVKDAGFPSTLTVDTSGKHQVIEAWTYNNGATVFVKYLGEY